MKKEIKKVKTQEEVLFGDVCQIIEGARSRCAT